MSESKTVCALDQENLYIGTDTADADPLEPGHWLIPADCVDAPLPEIPAGQAARWMGDRWQYLPDHRGQTAYLTDTGAAVTIEQVGDLPGGLTLLPPPDDCHVWDGSAWVADPAKQAARLAEQQVAAWEAIKGERERRQTGGVQLSNGKWLHTDLASRAQYLALKLMKMEGTYAAPQWKTMDNSMMALTSALLDELFVKLATVEQQNFANAETHRAAMLAVADPTSYDYGSGWQPVYEEAAS